MKTKQERRDEAWIIYHMAELPPRKAYYLAEAVLRKAYYLARAPLREALQAELKKIEADDDK